MTAAASHSLPSTVDPGLARVIRNRTASPSGALYGLRVPKNTLVQACGPREAARLFAGVAGWGSGFDARPLKPSPLHEGARAIAKVFEMLSPRHSGIAPALLGAGSVLRPPLQVECRNVFLAVLEQARVCGKSNLVLCGGQALLDAEDFERQAIPLHLEVDAAIVAHDDDDTAWVMEPPPELVRRLARGLSLLGAHSYNFGHWLTEFLPKLWACLDRPGFADVPILIDARMPPQHVEAVRLFAGADHPLVSVDYGQHVLVDELWVCSAPTYFPVGPYSDADVEYPDGLLNVDAALYQSLFQAGCARLPPPRPLGGQRIYLARGQGTRRQLVNRDEIEALFASHGFAVRDFGTLPFLEQVDLMRGARVVAGPDGSSFMATFFAPPGLRILCMATPSVGDYDMYNQICEVRGHTFETVIGTYDTSHPDYAGMSSFRVGAAALEAWLRELPTA